MEQVRWGILGPGQIAGWFATALPNARNGVLRAVGSSDPERARAFAETHAGETGAFAGTASEVIGRDDVDAVYVATVHPAHADLAIAALRAGHAVLCEKPLTPTSADTARVIAAARESDRPLIEAYKNRFSPFARAFDDVVSSGAIGAPRRLTAAFGFRAETREGRLFDPALAGGALLDVGCYPVSLAVAVAAAAGIDPAALTVTSAEGEIGPTGVDEHARVVITGGGLEAHLETSIRAELPDGAHLEGDAGAVETADVWGSRTVSANELRLTDAGGARLIKVATVDPFAAEADAIADALGAGRLEAPEMPWAHSLAIARLLDDWAAALRA